MKRILFVGMHNKPDIKPLCSSTKSGKLIDKIILQLKQIECVKTNLFDVEYLPTDSHEIRQMSLEWHDIYNPKDNDVIVLLGAIVHKHFWKCDSHILQIAHPSRKRSHVDMDEYVTKSTEQILNIIKKDMASDFEIELNSLIKVHVRNGLSKSDLVHKMKYTTQSCEMS
jgi:hypothetical protein